MTPEVTGSGVVSSASPLASSVVEGPTRKRSQLEDGIENGKGVRRGARAVAAPPNPTASGGRSTDLQRHTGRHDAFGSFSGVRRFDNSRKVDGETLSDTVRAPAVGSAQALELVPNQDPLAEFREKVGLTTHISVCAMYRGHFPTPHYGVPSLE